jgi:hypothetical protein
MRYWVSQLAARYDLSVSLALQKPGMICKTGRRDEWIME